MIKKTNITVMRIQSSIILTWRDRTFVPHKISCKKWDWLLRHYVMWLAVRCLKKASNACGYFIQFVGMPAKSHQELCMFLNKNSWLIRSPISKSINYDANILVGVVKNWSEPLYSKLCTIAIDEFESICT